MARLASNSADNARGGFSLVELLVSVMVLSVGLLAITGASAVIARQVSGGARMSLAASLAQSRFEQLRALECGTLASGSNADRGISESWTVQHVPGGVDVADTISFASARRQQVYAFRALLPCSAGRP
jgi:prepilin-type N-terminal cleavage/methylation domain-containing protein